MVKVRNQAGVTAGLAVEIPNTGKLAGSAKEEIRDLWLDMEMFDSQPLTPSLTGIGLEYRIIQLYSRDDGKRAAIFSFNVGQGSQDLGFRNDVSVTFEGERVGLGRAYVNLTGTLDYDRWCEGIRNGAAYVSDGRSHLMNLTVGDAVLGQQSELRLDEPQYVKVTANVAAYLKEKPEPGMHNLKPDENPYWHIERARLTGADLLEVEQQITGAEDALVSQVASDLKKPTSRNGAEYSPRLCCSHVRALEFPGTA